MQPFILTADIGSFLGPDSRVFVVPTSIRNKDELLNWYAEALSMPYFGRNWDALEECLRDLSWLSERRIVVFHKDVPLAANSADQRLYLDILAGAARDWKTDEDHELVVAFHPASGLDEMHL